MYDQDLQIEIRRITWSVARPKQTSPAASGAYVHESRRKVESRGYDSLAAA